MSAFPYVVRFGHHETNECYCARFETALHLGRALQQLYRNEPGRYHWHTVSIYNDANRTEKDSYGLTEAERDMWLEEELGEVF